ncbi:MAG TPA: DUF5670 family protein [Thermoanaerobaculia bacterium]|nr:DUF5670 family protein [Thermoanaerobaculia bacterium]
MTTIPPLLLITWLIALLLSFTFGGMIHLLPVVAVLIFLYVTVIRSKPTAANANTSRQ